MTALFHLLNRSPLSEGLETVEGDGISVWIFALLALISGWLTLLGGRFFATRSARERAQVFVITVIATSMVAIYFKASLTEPAELLKFVVLPVAFLLNIVLFAIFYHLFTRNTTNERN